VATSPGWLGYIPGFFEDLGRTATGLDNVSVSSLFHRGIELAVEISGLVNSLFPLAELILLPFRLGTALMIALAFAFAAYRLVEIKVFFAVMLGGLAFNLGFGGNPWTWPLAAGYLRGLAQKGIELTVAYFLVGHANAVLETWVEVAQSVTELTWGNYVTLMLAPPAISFLIWRMPEKVAAAVTSTWTLPSPFERA
ncbi:MAG: type IV secretion system protein, partial [Acidobacteria bacterium]|nr:type IV secretion system protein [Acidobacteriota bacterium]